MEIVVGPSVPQDHYAPGDSLLLQVANLGAGYMTNLRINRKLKVKKITWKKSIVLFPGVGVYVDGKKRYSLKNTDIWSAEEATGLIATTGISRDMALKIIAQSKPEAGTRIQ